MSTSTNHAKRSHRSEMRKRGAFNVSSRRAYYRDSPYVNNRGILSRLFRRKAPKQTTPREVEV